MGEAILITSGKGGVGKTTVTTNLGIALALSGKRVVVIDADIGLRNLDVVLGLENRVVYDLVHVIEGYCKLRQALVKDKRLENFYLLPAAQTRDKSAVDASQMRKLINEIKQSADYVLVDCPAGIEEGFKNAIAGTDRALVVTTPEMSAIRDADRIIGMVESYGQVELEPKRQKLMQQLQFVKTELQNKVYQMQADRTNQDLKLQVQRLEFRAQEIENQLRSLRYDIQLILNRYRTAMVKRGEMMNQDDVQEILNIPFIGVLPDSEEIVTSTNAGKPISFNDRSVLGNSFRAISERVQGFDVPLSALDEEVGFFSKMKQFMGIGRIEA